MPTQPHIKTINNDENDTGGMLDCIKRVFFNKSFPKSNPTVFIAALSTN